jgi:hypothetical protein
MHVGDFSRETQQFAIKVAPTHTSTFSAPLRLCGKILVKGCWLRHARHEAKLLSLVGSSMRVHRTIWH